jgi:hypothetical protein
MMPFVISRTCLWLGLLLLVVPSGRAQFLDSSVGLGAGLVKVFEPVRAFSARADVQVLDTNRQEVLRTPMNFALLDGKVRMDFDMTQMKGKSVQPSLVSSMKQINLNRVASVVRLDKRLIHVLFPGAQSYVDTELSAAETAAAEKNVQVQRTPLGKETIENHPCTKTRVVVKNAKGVLLLEATTWNASDLKEFPIQIAARAKDGTTIMRFSQMQMARPAAAQFEPPNGYTKYGNPDMLLLAAAQRTMLGSKSAPAKATAPAKPVATQKPSTNAVKTSVAGRKPAVTPASTNAAPARPVSGTKPQPVLRR